MDKLKIEELVKAYYSKNHSEYVITGKIMESLCNVISTAENINQVSESEQERQINLFLGKEGTIEFIREQQPLAEKVSLDIVDEIKTYFRQNLPKYIPLTVFRKSNHQEYSYLYSVLAANLNGEFACWTSWNESTHSLNHGHIGIQTKEAAMSVLRDNFHDITNETDKYGIEQSATIITDMDSLFKQNHKETGISGQNESQGNQNNSVRKKHR